MIRITNRICFSENKHILIGRGIFKDNYFLDYCSKLAKNIVLITDYNIYDIYGKDLELSFKKNNNNFLLVKIPPGENYKTRQSKEFIEDKMLIEGFNRDTCIIALGGGVILDLSGFVASTYCRGIKVVYLPTTLLAMVDASIGGKTGINTHFGKNMIGSFYEPESIFIDINVLKTLSEEDLKLGQAEIIKHSLIFNRELFFNFCSYFIKFHILQDLDYLMDVIGLNIRIKLEHTKKDFRDLGIRQILNFGHTIAHVLESLSDYRINHGRAVIIGILIESYISKLLGFLNEEDFSVIKEKIKQLNFDLSLGFTINIEEFMDKLLMDKKNFKDDVKMALIKSIGKPLIQVIKGKRIYTVSISKQIIEKALKWYCQIELEGDSC